MKYALLIAFPILTFLTSFMVVGTAIAIQPSTEVAVNSDFRLIHLDIEDVRSLAILDKNHLLISASIRNGQGQFNDTVITITQSQNKDGIFSIKKVPFGSIPYKKVDGLAISSDRRMVFVCDTAASRIYEQDASTGKLRGAIDTAGEPTDVVALGDGSLWYLTSDGRLHHYLQSRRTKVILDREAGKPLAIEGARGLALDSSTGEVVTGRGKSVVAVDPESGKVREFANGFSHAGDVCGVKVGDEESFLVVDDGLGKVYLVKMDGSKRVIFEGGEDGMLKVKVVRMLDEGEFVGAGLVGEVREDGRKGVLVIGGFDK